MLDKTTKRKIDNARDILVGKVPIPKSQIDLITITLIYKFMDDMDRQAEEIGGNASFFVQEFEKYAWAKVMDQSLGGYERLQLFDEGLIKMNQNPHIPALFREIFKNAFLPFRDPETLNMFLEEINDFDYGHSEKLGDAFEYLLSIMSSQGDAGQFRTPRHIIEFIVDVVNPTKTDKILDPACGTAGFLISAYKHIMEENTEDYYGDMLNSDERDSLANNIVGYDISPDMVRLSLVNMFLHKFPNPQIYEYDTLTNTERWEDSFSCILANPPFMSPKGGIKPHSKYAIKSKRSEVLFVDYMMEHLSEDGKAGIIVPEGIIFQSQKAHKELRKKMVEQNYLWAVVSLPSGIFQPYSGVKTSILLFDKARAKASDKIVFAKVQNDGYSLGSQRTPINKNDLPELIDALNYYKNKKEICENQCEPVAKEDESSHGLTQIETDKEKNFKNISIVEKSKLAENEYNLSGDRYFEEIVRDDSIWEIVKLGDILDICRGGSPRPIKDYITEDINGINWIKIGDVPVGGKYILNTKQKIKETGITKTRLVSENDFILSNSMSFGRPYIVKIPGAIHDGWLLLKVKSHQVNQDYLYDILCSEVVQNQYKRFATGGVVKNLNSEIVRNVKIPLPPLEVQEQIVAEIEGYQKIIDGAKQVVENYKPHIDIDPEWDVVELGEVYKPEYGFTDKSLDNGEYRFIRITDISEEGLLKKDNAKYINSSEKALKYVINKNDILVARTGATYGKTLFWENDEKSIFASFLMRLNPINDMILPKYYWAFSRSINYWSQANKLVTGVGQPQFNGNAIKKLKIPIPSKDIQAEIVSNIEEEQNYVDGCKKLIEIYEQKIKDRIDKVWEG